MADNTRLNPGSSGDTIATEDLGGGVKMPVTKIRLGSHGSDGGDIAANNPLPVSSPCFGSSVTVVAGSATDVTLLGSNSGRKGATIFNDSTATLYLLLGSGTSSTSNFTVALIPKMYFELPSFVWVGVIKGIWDSATGFARVTEFT